MEWPLYQRSADSVVLIRVCSWAHRLYSRDKQGPGLRKPTVGHIVAWLVFENLEEPMKGVIPVPVNEATSSHIDLKSLSLRFLSLPFSKPFNNSPFNLFFIVALDIP